MAEPNSQNIGNTPLETNPLTVAGYIGFFVVLGLAVVLFHGDRVIALIWAGACLASGATTGFLFGIPRTLQHDPKDPTDKSDGSYEQKVNTNLEQISDWLTKILVGLGLTQLQKIPVKLQELAGYMAEGMAKDTNTHTQRVFAAGLIVYFAVVGFIGGYLLTRLILARLFRKADTDSVAKEAQELQKMASPAGSAAAPPDGKDKNAGAADVVRATAIILKTYNDLENKASPQVLMSHIQELEGLKTQFPLFRMLYIILGRLYRWTGGRYDLAIEVLTQFIDAKKKDGSDGDEDTAAVMYNRACYYAQKILASPDSANELLSKAVADLKNAVARKKDYAEAARTDGDFDPIRATPEFKAAIGQPA